MLDWHLYFFCKLLYLSIKRINAAPARTKISWFGKDWQTIDVNSIRNKDARKVGAEWLCIQAISQLGLGTILADQTNNSVELYNIKNDIGETKNLCNVEVEKRDELLNELLNWQKETGAKIPTVVNLEYEK